jgi:Rrf2 family protein
MNLTLTRRGDYAVRAAVFLAGVWDRTALARTSEIAAAMSLPGSYTPQILGLLTRAGLVTAKAGPAGGYRLARDPASISLLEVVEAAEGELVSTTCILRGGPCHWEHACAVHGAWTSASEAFRGRLRQTTLTDLANADHDLATGATRSRPTS